MTTTTGTPPCAVSSYRWAITLAAPGRDPVEVTGTMTSAAAPEQDERAIRAAAEDRFRRGHPDVDGPLSVLSFSLDRDEP